MDPRLKLYTIDDDYIKYLRSYIINKSTILHNKNSNRPYVGIILKINDHTYFAPLTSDKRGKYINTNKPHIIKIKNNNVYYGSVLINNMIPVSKSLVRVLHYNNVEDKNYAILIANQINILNKLKPIILKNAAKFYDNVCSNSNEFFKSISNDFMQLEEKLNKYTNKSYKSQSVS